MNKILKSLFFTFGIIFSLYLILPGPSLPPPDLPDSLKSDEPGDTIQLINVSAYYTEKDRETVIKFYQDYFSRSSFLNIPLPTIRLNHPPETAKTIIKDTMQTYYLEELAHPLRESLFINGFEWEKDVFTPVEKRAKNKMIYRGIVWPAKITLKWSGSNTLVRLAVFWPAWILFGFCLGLFIQQIKLTFKNIFFKK